MTSGFRGFPYKTFPRGWYQIAWSQELAVGDVRPVKYFSLDLVMYRAESGKVVVLDAYCRHMGAHLGHGGKVCGEEIICPFHGWKWGSDGSNTEIPYSKLKRLSTKHKSWPILEKSGLVLLWYSPEGSSPEFEPPEVPEFNDPAYYPIHPHGMAKAEVRFPPQYQLENGVDIAHLKCVHHWDVGEPKLNQFQDRGNSFYVEISGAINTPRGVSPIAVKIEAWSVGLIYSHLTSMRDMGFVSGMVPIDESRSEIRLSTTILRQDGLQSMESDKFAKVMIDAQVNEVIGSRSGGDRDIWEHMEYRDKPAVMREEVAGWRALRNWASKYYSDAVKPAPMMEVESALSK